LRRRRNKFLIAIFTIFGVAAGIFALQRTPLDAIPDQRRAIVYTIGKAGRPTSSRTDYLSISTLHRRAQGQIRARNCSANPLRYVIFEDGTDIYWARC
jgi:Cu(I)/Ag(I) efflux system membrane protein CusA/SilA